MHRFPRRLPMVLLVVASVYVARGEAVFTVDFARSGGAPLAKGKFGVYQTPLVSGQRLVGSLPLLREAGVRDFRYEIGWGKPDALGAGQVGGDAGHPTMDFAVLDPLRDGLRAAGVRPLLALGYCPDPLKSGTGRDAWKDLPKDLDAWRAVCRAFAGHWRAPEGSAATAYEVWNEPDMPEGQGKMFFAGTAADYGRLYAATLSGVREGDPRALVGGPAAAYDLRYLATLLTQPMSFASIHGYANYREQTGSLRRALGARTEVPMFLSEYASYTAAEMTPNGPQSRCAAAMRFFRDVRGMLEEPRLEKVYWAQWLDAGDAPGMGLVTFDGHRKAIFNAFKIYGELPERRVESKPSGGGEGVGILASADGPSAGIVLWNEVGEERAARVELAGGLPSVKGQRETVRIDRRHGSYVDDPAEETLRAEESVAVDGWAKVAWQGTIPAGGVVYLRWRAER